MTDFLPSNYNVPSTSDKYYKFKNGANQFRIMSPPILGNEYWVDGAEGSRKPVRLRMDQKIEVSEVDPSQIKHFWAMVVWDYEAQKPKILEITQKGIMKSIQALYADKDWGSPVGSNGYDIVVTKTGEGMDTEYNTNPKPHKKLDKAIEEQVKTANINLEALFEGKDPFNSQVVEEVGEIKLDDLDKDPANEMPF